MHVNHDDKKAKRSTQPEFFVVPQGKMQIIGSGVGHGTYIFSGELLQLLQLYVSDFQFHHGFMEDTVESKFKFSQSELRLRGFLVQCLQYPQKHLIQEAKIEIQKGVMYLTIDAMYGYPCIHSYVIRQRR